MVRAWEAQRWCHRGRTFAQATNVDSLCSDPVRGSSKAAQVFADIITELDDTGVELQITLEVSANSKDGFAKDVEEVSQGNVVALEVETKRFD